jgi:hypothetical protein
MAACHKFVSPLVCQYWRFFELRQIDYWQCAKNIIIYRCHYWQWLIKRRYRYWHDKRGRASNGRRVYFGRSFSAIVAV